MLWVQLWSEQLLCTCVLQKNLLPPHKCLSAWLPKPELWLQLLPALLPPSLL
uniref:Alternative protein KRTAP9-3 n=1 Tax=Homo sapiens TaxID=9606 RepID=L8E8W9_HUMAN|nr:alternative protein KRTAP9-3 [Homo sapiens]